MVFRGRGRHYSRGKGAGQGVLVVMVAAAAAVCVCVGAERCPFPPVGGVTVGYVRWVTVGDVGG